MWLCSRHKSRILDLAMGWRAQARSGGEVLDATGQATVESKLTFSIFRQCVAHEQSTGAGQKLHVPMHLTVSYIAYPG